MSDLIGVRDAVPPDLEALFQLHKTVFRSHVEQIWGWDESWQRDRFEKECESSAVLVVSVGGKTVGYLQTVTGEKGIFLRNIALHPVVQGHGIGTQLVGQLQEEAREQGLAIGLAVFHTNPRAVAFYERLGFVKSGRTDTHVEMSWRAT